MCDVRGRGDPRADRSGRLRRTRREGRCDPIGRGAVRRIVGESPPTVALFRAGPRRVRAAPPRFLRGASRPTKLIIGGWLSFEQDSRRAVIYSGGRGQVALVSLDPRQRDV